MNPERPLKLVVLLSGGGTTLRNLAQKIRERNLNAAIPLVVASRPCGGVELSRELGLRCEVVTRLHGANPPVGTRNDRSGEDNATQNFSDRIFQLVREAEAELVVLAGFLSRLTIPDDFRHRVLNIHPALIPAFCGKGMHGHHVHEAVLARGAKVSGCTVHFADNEYDHGPIVLQRVVPVLDDDSPATLAARVFAAECEAYPAAIRLFAEGRLQVQGDSRVKIAAMGVTGNGRSAPDKAGEIKMPGSRN